jgi:hypothetical protein
MKKKWLVALKGQYVQGNHRKPIAMLEATT